MNDIITIKISQPIYERMVKQGITNTESQVEFIRNSMALFLFVVEGDKKIFIKSDDDSLVEIDMEDVK